MVLNNQQRREGIERALEGEGIAFVHSEEWIAKPNTVVILQGLLTDGFELPNSHLVVVVEGNIYGQQKTQNFAISLKRAKKLIILRIYRSEITLFTACMVSVNMWA